MEEIQKLNKNQIEAVSAAAGAMSLENKIARRWVPWFGHLLRHNRMTVPDPISEAVLAN